MILYKYYPCNEYTFRALSELGLWCSPASNMNDPFDCLGQIHLNIKPDHIQEIRDYIKAQFDSSIDSKIYKMLVSLNDDQLITTIFNTRKNLIETLTFCSLTQDAFNLLMWSHYANSHQGIVLGINIDDLIIKNNLMCRKISYQNFLPNFSPKSIFMIFNSSQKKLNQLTIEDLEAIKDFISLLSIKTSDWSYEEEWRIWYLLAPQYYYYNTIDLKSVYFGLRCPEETKTLVKSILRGHGVSDDVYHDIKVETYPEIRLTI